MQSNDIARRPSAVRICRHCGVLFKGTNADNTYDMVNKGRHGNPDLRGARNGRAKLTEDQVRAIRSELARGAYPYQIAPRYGVSSELVGMIARGRVWRHLE